MNFFLGVDGGQSSTTAVIGDDRGHIAGWARGGPCNHVAAEEARKKFLRVIGECIGQAAGGAGGAGPEPLEGRWRFRAACLGMSGGPEDKAGLLAELIDSPDLIVTHDAAIALAGALEGHPGIVVIAGTGSLAFGRNAAGETARAGGWGYIFGDEGSAFDMARQGLRAALREQEGWGPRTALTPALVAATGAAEPNQMLHLFYTPDWPRSRVAELAPLVGRIAEEGDPVARGILQSSARQLADLVRAVRRQLFSDEEPARVSAMGGVFTNRVLSELFRESVASNGHNQWVAPRHGAAIGALLLAWRAAGIVPVLPVGLDPDHKPL
jgi:N-acetylglucosamine kinase-like BadF-type ATPase